MERQIQRQRILAAACKRLGLGHEAPNFKTSDMYINDTFKYIYCVVNKVTDCPVVFLLMSVHYSSSLGRYSYVWDDRHRDKQPQKKKEKKKDNSSSNNKNKNNNKRMIMS